MQLTGLSGSKYEVIILLSFLKQPTAEEYNSSITFRIRVDDDGTVLERKNGPEEYRIKKDETKYSVHNCSVLIACMYSHYYM
jgi:hypothetical protein